jgi:hypothetical protein
LPTLFSSLPSLFKSGFMLTFPAISLILPFTL